MDVGEQFTDTMLKGFAAWKSAAGSGLLQWGFVVLQKPVGKRNGVLRALLFLKAVLAGGQSVAHSWDKCRNPSNQCTDSACDAHTCAYTIFDRQPQRLKVHVLGLSAGGYRLLWLIPLRCGVSVLVLASLSTLMFCFVRLPMPVTLLRHLFVHHHEGLSRLLSPLTLPTSFQDEAHSETQNQGEALGAKG